MGINGPPTRLNRPKPPKGSRELWKDYFDRIDVLYRCPFCGTRFNPTLKQCGSCGAPNKARFLDR